MKTVKTGITLPNDLLRDVAEFMKETNIRSRSKLISEALRMYLAERKFLLQRVSEVVGGVFIVYNHERGETLMRLVDVQHKYLDIIKSVLHMHITHEKCMEILVIEGKTDKIRELVSALENIIGVELVRIITVEKKGI